MEFKSNVNADCCTPTGKYELCGCVNGVPYIQLTVVGGGTVQTAWLNTETGDTFTSKPVGFVTGTCQEAELSDVLKFSATAPTATAPFANPKDGYTTIQTSDGTEDGDVDALWLYDEQTSTWKEIKLGQDILWTDITTAPNPTGNTPGPRFEILSANEIYFIDSVGRAEKFQGGCTTRTKLQSFDATVGQTSFTLAFEPLTDVDLSRNGVTLRLAAQSVSGTTVTYLPVGNNGETLKAGDAIDISYTYEDCTSSLGDTKAVAIIAWSGDNLVATFTDGTTQTLTTPTC